MERKITASLTLVAFLVFTNSCIKRTIQKVPPEAASGERADVLGILTASGEQIEFPKNAPGRIQGDKVVGLIPGQGEKTIPNSQVQSFQTTSDGRILILTTKDGKRYVSGQLIKADKEEIVVRVETEIPLKDIELIWIRKIDPGMTFLATIGAVGLALGTVMLIIALTKESCPFIYSFNGERYVFDAEPFGAAICEGLKRTEWCALEEIKEVDGRYNILISNEVEETQYTDELKLVVVDHAQKIRVLPDEFGRMHTVLNPLPPRRAFDEKGRDLLPAVGGNDWKYWLSRAADLSRDATGPTKHELSFEFPKPEGAKTARLIFNGCTTLWGSQMIKRLLDLRGNTVQEWYDDAAGGGPSLKKTMMMGIREELYRMHIRVETAHGWTSKGLIQGGGPLISESRLYSFDVSDVPGDTLRIKLTPASTFWMINWLGVDYSEDKPILVNEVAPLEANDASGRDVRNLLLLEDGKYLVMPRTGDRAWVSFLSPPRQEGSERSVFVKAGGYYDIHLEAKAAPQTEILQRMLSEPGYVVRYAVKEYLEWRAEAGQKVRIRSN